MELRARHHHLTFPRRPLVMGILNVNDDSFCDDGSLDPGWATGRMADLIRDGAEILDVGAESARTNRPPISEQEEIDRLLPVIAAFQSAIRNPQSAILSVNTWRPTVAAAALAAGADLLNDMGGLPTDENARLCAAHGAALLIMHTRGAPKVPHLTTAYPDVIADILEFFEARIAQATAAGLPFDRIILDPGIDFAKQRADNLTVYRHLDRLATLGRPILLPVSRKTVIGEVLGRPNPNDRDPGTAACLVAGHQRGAAIFRVHNVAAARQVIDTLEAVQPLRS